MRIGELAGRTGVSTRALRYYEEQQLLSAERGPSRQRYYPEAAVEQVRLIQQLYAAGLSSKTIAELMPCVVDGMATPELLDRLMAERDLLRRRVAELVQIGNRLDSVIASAAANMTAGTRCQSN